MKATRINHVRVILGCGAAAAAAATIVGCGKAQAQGNTTSADRGVELTVYKDDFAMVSERRPVQIDNGHSKIVIDDISKELDPDSVLFEWANAKNHPSVVATTYNLGVGSGTSLISRLNGQQVQLMWPSTDGKPGELVSGRLEAAQQGSDFALRTPDKLYVNPTGTIVASSGTASTLPQLSVELDSRQTGKQQLGMSYLTRGMSWSADYVAKLNPDEKTAEIDCWATVINKTGIPFPTAKLTLMAGSPNRLVLNSRMQTGEPNGGVTLNDSLSSSSKTRMDGGLITNVPREAVGDLYAYKIPSTASIGTDQMNRVSVLGTRTVPVKKTYSIRIPTLSASGYWFDNPNGNSIPHVTATVALSFVNEASSNLGVPLPAGNVRVYEKDGAGREQYTGADQIADTPKAEHVSLTLANAFDVYGTYKVLKSQRLGKHIIRKTVDVEIFNEKKAPVEVRLVQSFEGHWTPVDESLKSEKLDSNTVQWKPTVQAGLSTRVLFTVDMRV